MKKRRFFQVILCVALASVLAAGAIMSGCDRNSGGPGNGNNQGENATPDSGGKRFNEGIVNYETVSNESFTNAFDDAKIGTPVKGDEQGLEVIFEADFEDGDVTCGEEAVARSEDAVGIVGGKLYVPYSGDPENPANNGGWTTWAPVSPLFDGTYKGVQISMDCEITSSGSGAWMAPFFGLYKKNVGTIADSPSDGLYLALNAQNGRVNIFCATPDNWKWPEGNASSTLNKDVLKAPVHIDIICVGDALADKEISLFLNGSLYLKLSIDTKNGRAVAENANGKKVLDAEIDPELFEGEYMSVFSHLGCVAIDNMKIYGYSKGVKKVETEIKAVPVGDNKLGLDITDKKDIVSICYTVWFNAINGQGTTPLKDSDVADVSRLLKEYNFTPEEGFVNKKTGETQNQVTRFHYWGKPAQGYYRSNDKNAIRNNMTLIYEAGVDFIIIDLTYATAPGYKPGSEPWNSYIGSSIVPLLDTIMEMRAEGKGTPYVVFWMGSENMFEYMDEHFMAVEKWKDCFVYWDGKPFIMKWIYDPEVETYEKWTVRGMYGLRGKASEGQWSYLEIDNSKTVSYDKNGAPEHVCCDIATQETYMSLPTAHGRDGGKFFRKQWETAFEIHPKIVTVTWWNEWCAQLYKVDGVGYIFTDNFNQEYSRDIEPMEGGHGDLYYRMLKSYVEAYKEGKKMPAMIKK